MTEQTNIAERAPEEVLDAWLNSSAQTMDADTCKALERLLSAFKGRGERIDSLNRALAEIGAERVAAAKQRDFLGGQVSGWIARFYGLKVANGELAPGALPLVVANEVGALEQSCARIAQEAQQE